MNDSDRIAALELQVGELQRKLDFVLRHLGVAYQEPALGPGLTEAAALLAQGDKIGAMKIYQRNTGAGLKDAKDAIDALERTLKSR